MKKEEKDWKKIAQERDEEFIEKTKDGFAYEPTARETYDDLVLNKYRDPEKMAGVTRPGEFIKYGRTQMGLSQEDLANKLGVKQNTLSRYETGTREIPFELFEKAMNILGFIFKIEKK